MRDARKDPRLRGLLRGTPVIACADYQVRAAVPGRPARSDRHRFDELETCLLRRSSCARFRSVMSRIAPIANRLARFITDDN
jgi:hypothetical protein